MSWQSYEVAREVTKATNFMAESSNEGVVRPLQKSLPLPWATPQITRFAMRSDLGLMAPECPPTFNLYLVNFGKAAAQIITAVPLKPATWVRTNYPTLVLPYA